MGDVQKDTLKSLEFIFVVVWEDFAWLTQQKCVFWLTTQIDWDLEDCCFRTENHQRVSQKWWHKMRFDCSSFGGMMFFCSGQDTFHKPSKQWSFQSGEIQEKIQGISFRMNRDHPINDWTCGCFDWMAKNQRKSEIDYILGNL